jgi:hypothetical protein
VLTLAAAGSYTLTIPATGTAALGSGANGRVSYWTGANTLGSDSGLLYNAATDKLTATGDVECFHIQTTNGHPWDLGGYTAGGVSAATGTLWINVDGTVYHIPCF